MRTALYGAVSAILDAYRRGTRYGIRMTPDGLLTQGEPGKALTWMDARSGEHCITPRAGEAVELQALWYNALLSAAGLAQQAGDSRRSGEWRRLARLAHASFLARFWSEPLGHLADVVSDGAADFSLRPNQLFAIGLPHALLPREKAVRVLEVVRRHLLTPVGLRTLAPGDPAYLGRCDGDSAARAAASHQGTVWPWLMGVYFDALVASMATRAGRGAGVAARLRVPPRGSRPGLRVRDVRRRCAAPLRRLDRPGLERGRAAARRRGCRRGRRRGLARRHESFAICSSSSLSVRLWPSSSSTCFQRTTPCLSIRK